MPPPHDRINEAERTLISVHIRDSTRRWLRSRSLSISSRERMSGLGKTAWLAAMAGSM